MAGYWSGVNYFGDATNEAVTAYGGNEVLHGAEGDDQLFGGAGDDYLDGGVGSDLLDGGVGNDRLNDVDSIPFGYVGLIGRDTLRGGNGNDELNFSSVDTGDVANGGNGVDLVWIDMGIFSNTSYPTGTVVSFTMGPGGATSNLKIDLANTLTVLNVERLTYFGVNTVDFITGGALDDRIYGGADNDHLYGGDGDDYIDGGSGIQDMDGGIGFDTVSFDLSGMATAVNLTNRATVNLGAFGSVRNFEAYAYVTLGSGNDVVNLTQAGAVTIVANGGNNRITIGDGGSDIESGAGDDVFNTGNGYDEVDGGGGNNMAHLGGGDDEYAHRLNRDYTGIETIFGEAGRDVIATAAGADVADGGDDDDEIYVGQGNDRAYGGLGADEIYGETGLDSLYGGDGDDWIDSDLDYYLGTGAAVEADLLDGGNGNDRLKGGTGADRFFGGAGDDTLTTGMYTAAGAVDLAVDIVFGGAGNDVLGLYGPSYSGTEAIQVLLRANTLLKVDGVVIARAQQIEALAITAYGGGNHHIEGGALYDSVITGHGDDLIRTFDGNDVIQSTFGSDTIYAGNGDDTVSQVEMGGDDLLYGGAGNDVFSIAVPYLSQVLDAGISRVDGGAGIDRLQLYNSDRVVTFNGTQLFADGVQVALISGFESLAFYGSAIGGVMVGYSGDDLLVGGGGNDTISGNGGNDSLDGGTEDDKLYGGLGNDTILSGTGTDTVSGGAGDDSLTPNFDGLADVLDGGAGIDTLFVGYTPVGPIVMTGAPGAGGTISVGGVLQATFSGIEIVNGTGTAGNDVLIGGTGNDTLYAYNGADTISTGAGDDKVTLLVDGQVDSVAMGGGTGDWIILFQQFAGNMVFALSQNAVLTIGGVAITTVTGAEVMTISGALGNDTLTGGAQADTIYLGEGANRGIGGDGDDTISLNVDAMADTVNGGLGVDKLVLYGGQSAFAMAVGAAGRVTVSVAGAAVADAIAIETIEAYGGYGALADDVLRGWTGNDTLYGGIGSDLLFGGAGADVLQGGDGIDIVRGGSGADRFLYFSATQAAVGGVFDLIVDFQTGVDQIDLAAVDADGLAFGNGTFVWLAAAGFTGVAGELRSVQDAAGGRTLIEGDTSGDGVADLVIELTGLIAVQAGDLLL